jgi:hypothetical protein
LLRAVEGRVDQDGHGTGAGQVDPSRHPSTVGLAGQERRLRCALQASPCGSHSCLVAQASSAAGAGRRPSVLGRAGQPRTRGPLAQQADSSLRFVRGLRWVILPSVVLGRRGGGCSLADVGDRPGHWFLPTRKYVTISPLPLTGIGPRRSKRYPSLRRSYVRAVTWMQPATPWDSMRLAVFTVSPHRS